ncbi:MAG: glycosyltransferase family 39 protein [Flavobacteriales bacterium]|nr:glycosyltransferase family 39 protein [Flavobacteriales bacterium]
MGKVRTFLQRMDAVFWFIILFILMSCAYEVGRVLHLPPQPHHLWRQADCISLAWNYYDTTWNFFQPTIHNLFSDGYTSGKVAGEFPILYYLVGMIWRITGPSEFIYRLIGFLLHFVGTLALFASVRRILDDGFWAVCVALLFYASPAIVYFGIGFLTDVPAFDLALIGWWFVVRYATDRRQRSWGWAVFFFSLAMLIKVTAGMSLIALVGVLFFHTVFRKRATNSWSLFKGDRREWATLVMSLVAVYVWYAYAAWYNGQHGGHYTFNDLWPIWGMDPTERLQAWDVGRRIVVFQVFDTSVWILIGVAFTALTTKVRRLPRQVIVLNALLLVGTVLYVLFWFHALDNHDYYFINPMVTLAVLLVSFLWMVKRSYPELLHARWSRWAIFTLLAFNVAYTAQNMQMRYDTSGTMTADDLWPIYHDAELAHWNALSYWSLENVVNIAPKLRAMGIRPEDRVIFADDPTINASLVFMGNRGWTSYGNHLKDPGWMDILIANGAKYFLCVDPAWTWDPQTGPFLHDPVGVVDGVSIYRLHPLDRTELRNATRELDTTSKDL